MQTEGKKARKPSKTFNARMKAQAVLSLWSGRRQASALCRELSISWGVLSQWQEKAMEGMLLFLEPKCREESICPSLSSRLKDLLDRKASERETSSATLRVKEKPPKPPGPNDPA